MGRPVSQAGQPDRTASLMYFLLLHRGISWPFFTECLMKYARHWLPYSTRWPHSYESRRIPHISPRLLGGVALVGCCLTCRVCVSLRSVSLIEKSVRTAARKTWSMCERVERKKHFVQLHDEEFVFSTASTTLLFELLLEPASLTSVGQVERQ